MAETKVEARLIVGTFTGTGQSSTMVAGDIAIDLTFAGTATVAVQWQVDGTNWRTVNTYTSSNQLLFSSNGTPVRLNCTAHTNNVSYAMRAV